MLKKIIIILVGLMLLISCGGPDKDANGYWESAEALADVGNFEGAIEQYNKILEYYPSDSLASKSLLRIGEIKRSKTKDYQEAISIYKKYLKKYPNKPSTPNAMFMIGYVYANDVKDYEKAKKSYNQFLEKYSNHELAPSARWELKNMGKNLQEVIQTENISETSQESN